MILAYITPDGIKKVQVEANSAREQDLDLKVWPLVRHSLNQLNRKLQRQKADAPKEIRGWLDGYGHR